MRPRFNGMISDPLLICKLCDDDCKRFHVILPTNEETQNIKKNTPPAVSMGEVITFNMQEQQRHNNKHATNNLEMHRKPKSC